MISNHLHDVADKQAKRKSRQYEGLAEYLDNCAGEMDIEEFLKTLDKDIMLEEVIMWYRIYRKAYIQVFQIRKLPHNLRRSVKSFYQRGKRGYADEDVWSLDSYLARVISSATADLRDISHGYPARDEWKGLTPDQAYEQWQRELTMISEAFSLYRSTHDKHIDPQTFERFVHNFYDLWD